MAGGPSRSELKAENISQAKENAGGSVWIVELALMWGVGVVSFVTYPVILPFWVSLWIIRYMYMFKTRSEYPRFFPDPTSRVQLSLMFAVCLLAGVASIHACELYFGWDPLAVPFVNGELVSVDSWSVVHVWVFLSLGYLYPDQTLLFAFYGVLWEVVEYVLSGDHDFWGERGVNSMWDIYFNLIGYRLGELLFINYGPEGQVVQMESYKEYARQRAKQEVEKFKEEIIDPSPDHPFSFLVVKNEKAD
eukprot:comp15539_c0_seq1/m.12591 comp15539_c0_seq1/g.12591  ORF comp15539_c0_seq1/g.12591 comp15539_c0_seq1/m.12591 type:complete len:248 (-) comp15539_c0_seq1:53-796(-)